MQQRQQEEETVANPQPQDEGRMVLSEATEFVRKIGVTPSTTAAPPVVDDSEPVVKRTASVFLAAACGSVEVNPCVVSFLVWRPRSAVGLAGGAEGDARHVPVRRRV